MKPLNPSAGITRSLSLRVSLLGDVDDNSEVVSASCDTEIRLKSKNQHSVQERRPTDKVNDKGAINDKEEIQATISAIVAHGHNAQLDASLKLLSADDPKLVLPNDLEDDEIHNIESNNYRIIEP
ncbi:MAG: hypothetical protein Q9184_001648 [Pyrenodesmia sp. 2 TL-2023]